MPSTDTQAFLDALQTLERDGDEQPLVDLHAPEATCDNLTLTDALTGPDGARAFWRADRSLFQQVESTFHNVVQDGDHVALEWSRSGTGRSGEAVGYDGVSVITFADGKITRFRAYYDPSALGDAAI